MARNITFALTGDDKARSAHYANIVSQSMGEDTAAVEFRYTNRATGVTDVRSAKPVEIVGEAGQSSHGFKGITDKGPRTFNFHLMG